MHDNDSFRLFDREEAGFWVLILAAVAFISLIPEEKPKAKPAPKPAAVVPCATIQQYGPGERWASPSSKSPSPACAGAALDPRHILTPPLQASR